MVRKNGFTLEVVYADSKEPFKEHIDSNGNTYADVEPDTEYFIRIRNDSNRAAIFDNYCVYGKGLGYSSKIQAHANKICGLRQCENYSSYHKALRFNKLCRHKHKQEAPRHGGDYDGHWTGSIEVKVYEYIELDGYKSRENKYFSSNWTPNSNQVLEGLDLSSNKKACNSIEGMAKTKVRQQHTMRRNYRRGSKLATLKLRYCSTVGLFAAGILRPPSAQPKPSASRTRRTIKHDHSDERKRGKKSHADNGEPNVRTYSIQTTQTFEVVEIS